MLFKNGNRSFYVFSKDEPLRKAMREANKHIKTKLENLEIQSGKMLDEDTVQIGCKGNLWIISRRGKA